MKDKKKPTRETLTVEEVETIRKLGRSKMKSYSQLAQEYNVEIGHIKFIVTREDR